MSSRRATFSLSFLDTLSNAMGAAILLAVIFSLVRTPTSPAQDGSFIFVEVISEGPGDIAVLVRPPGSSPVAVLTGSQGESELAETKTAAAVTLWGGAVLDDRQHPARRALYLELRTPKKGDWAFRPYYSDYQDQTGTVRFSSVRIWTDSTKPMSWNEQPPSDLIGPFHAATGWRTVTVAK